METIAEWETEKKAKARRQKEPKEVLCCCSEFLLLALFCHYSLFIALDHGLLAVIIAGRFGEEESKGAGGVQRRDEADQQGGRRVEAVGGGQEKERRGQSLGEGGQNPVDGEAPSVLWLLLKPWTHIIWAKNLVVLLLYCVYLFMYRLNEVHCANQCKLQQQQQQSL